MEKINKNLNNKITVAATLSAGVGLGVGVSAKSSSLLAVQKEISLYRGSKKLYTSYKFRLSDKKYISFKSVKFNIYSILMGKFTSYIEKFLRKNFKYFIPNRLESFIHGYFTHFSVASLHLSILDLYL